MWREGFLEASSCWVEKQGCQYGQGRPGGTKPRGERAEHIPPLSMSPSLGSNLSPCHLAPGGIPSSQTLLPSSLKQMFLLSSGCWLWPLLLSWADAQRDAGRGEWVLRGWRRFPGQSGGVTQYNRNLPWRGVWGHPESPIISFSLASSPYGSRPPSCLFV